MSYHLSCNAGSSSYIQYFDSLIGTEEFFGDSRNKTLSRFCKQPHVL